ncbi:related to rab geranylgeranyl transferase component A [Cephalotrichum gorgonifer]|uniref:Rab proteins geranylgeranyltransferase n=1 Tax=Cephalotrichum gorgonifer TaxID=2041049 RepID=A0AAE8MVE0_9PEZI|nr:related to rab geranylgeranyl transferase component A [Cephalotrichum gorgonifer]
MESLTESTWDVVIHGTGLQQSLLVLALSRSGKKILHVDPNEYYGGPDAALTLQDAESWLEAHSGSSTGPSLFRSAAHSKAGEQKEEGRKGLSSGRAYSLSLSPQIIHARSTLLSHLVSSRAYRQLEFLAVGSFFIYRPGSESESAPRAASLTRIPATREAVFSNTEIAPRSKRSLMKFLKFVLDHDSEANLPLWTPRADDPLDEFLLSDFKLDSDLRAYVVTLTLSQTGDISVRDGLAVLHRHLTSTGFFGPGFAALYPKWGGGSEVAQVACRAGAVGGAVYMLGTDIRSVARDDATGELEIELTTDVTVKSRTLVRGDEAGEKPTEAVARLVAVVDPPLRSLFEVVVEGSPAPAVAVVAFPAGSLEGGKYPVYVVAHSSDTGECPSGQSILYLSTTPSPTSKSHLETALAALLPSISVSGEPEPKPLYTLYYEQAQGAPELRSDGGTLTLPSPRISLSFDDGTLDIVREAWGLLWDKLGGGEERGEFMVFEDREGADDDEM